MENSIKSSYIACGCYWGVQYYFDKAEGIIDTCAGFMGGEEKEPTYSQVKHHLTGHAETVKVTYDTDVISYEQVLHLFFEIHDFSQVGGIGTDIGPQYRSELFYKDEQERSMAIKVMDELRAMGYEVNTRLTAASEFWPAHAEHQHYFDHNEGEPDCHIRRRIWK